MNNDLFTHNDKVFEKVSYEIAEILIKLGRDKPWYNKPFADYSLYGFLDYEEEQFICELEDLHKAKEIGVELAVFRGFKNHSDAMCEIELSDKMLRIVFNEDSGLYTIDYFDIPKSEEGDFIDVENAFKSLDICGELEVVKLIDDFMFLRRVNNIDIGVSEELIWHSFSGQKLDFYVLHKGKCYRMRNND